MEERGARERVDALLDKAAGLGAGSLRLAVLSGNGERVVDGTALRPRAELCAWLGEGLLRHRAGETGGRFRLRLLDAGGRAAGSVVFRGDDLGVGVRSDGGKGGAAVPAGGREVRRAEVRPTPPCPVTPESSTSTGARDLGASSRPARCAQGRPRSDRHSGAPASGGRAPGSRGQRVHIRRAGPPARRGARAGGGRGPGLYDGGRHPA